MVFAIQLLFFIVRLDRTTHAAVLRERFTRARHAVTGFVYILASQKNGTLYVGVTADIPRRMHEHRTGVDRLRVEIRGNTARLVRRAL
jgi:hypothetical protein